MTAIVIRPSSRELREFAIENGYARSVHGRISDAAIRAFNAGRNPMHRYVRAENNATHTVFGPRGGVVRTRNYNRDAARAWAVANGYTHSGSRGRLTRDALDAYVMSL
jgi:hypothetical protein